MSQDRSVVDKELLEKVKEIKRSKDKSKNKKQNTASMVLSEGKVYEQIQRDGENLFLSLEEESKEVDGIVPIDSDAIKKGMILLPDGIEEYEDISALTKEIQEHVHKYLDISEDMEIFAVYYILLSWLYDKTKTLNYFRFLGDWGSGKSRALDIIGRLCYKPILVFGALTPAVVYRMLDLWKGTLVVDEGDFNNSDEQNEIMKIFNAGFEKSRASVARCNPNDVSIIDTFEVFGPKVISSRKTWRDKALESRCLTERMMQTTRKDIIPVLDDDYYEKENSLRRKLLKFRFDYYNKIKYEYHDLGIDELEPRLKQAVASFTTLLENIPELMERFKAFIREYNKQLIDERSDSYEGYIVQALADLLLADQVYITTSDIVAQINESFGTEYKPRSVGRVLKSFGFDNKLMKIEAKTMRTLILDENVLKTIFERYLPIGHEMRKKVTKVTKVTTASGGLCNFVTQAQTDNRGNKTASSPHSDVTNVTNVTEGSDGDR